METDKKLVTHIMDWYFLSVLFFIEVVIYFDFYPRLYFVHYGYFYF